ncbi:hypothetical protein MNBD_IGNAVI01-280 [hydrothermal vent metagenome]|uniref:Uncharacterized protein n=1 Tax=hydrothermal vent metagenome TaxID=652676 RepID=A0A3B1BZN5_9ZZZZ
MNFFKQYILQALSLATNNLRLSPDRVETVAYLKDYLNNSEDIEKEIAMMKTKTELSKFAIKLGEAYKFVSGSNVDFLKLTDVFKEHSNNLIVELSNVLDMVTTEKLKEILAPVINEEELAIDLGDIESTKNIPTQLYEETSNDKKESEEIDSLKEELILEEVTEHDKFDFADFEEKILKPVSKLEKMLKELEADNVPDEDLKKFISLIKKHAEISEEIGFNILAEMHTVLYTALMKVQNKEVMVDKKLVESMRACLIVIVAIVRSKDVDITNYINRAEKLGKYLESLSKEK